MEPIIEIKNVGKKYDINHNGGRYIALRDVLMNIIKSPFLFLKTKAKDAAGINKKEEFWALKDVSININHGEIVGVIGKNGAGKSTLLKILSQITPPTTGEIKIRGKVGSLLEVGTGFHPELTGRENIFLNGAILGMSKKEIASKFDQIVEFAGVDKFLDTPVKYYSSGMYVRLAFSVAAHMEPDILIVDEVLAVGDAEFQKKSLGKMDEITKKEGRTIIFVSHNMSAIRQLCNKTILLENGNVKKYGPTNEIIDTYLGIGKDNAILASSIDFKNHQNKNFQISNMSVRDNKNNTTSTIPIEEDFFVDIKLDIKEKIDGICIILILVNQDGQHSANFMELDTEMNALDAREPGIYNVSVKIPGIFNSGTYTLRTVVERGDEVLDIAEELRIRIVDNKSRIYRMQLRTYVIPKAEWRTKKLSKK